MDDKGKQQSSRYRHLSFEKNKNLLNVSDTTHDKTQIKVKVNRKEENYAGRLQDNVKPRRGRMREKSR